MANNYSDFTLRPQIISQDLSKWKQERTKRLKKKKKKEREERFLEQTMQKKDITKD